MKTSVFSILSFFILSVNAFAYTYLFSEHSQGVAAIADSNGKILWAVLAPHPQSVDISKDGSKIFVSYLNGAIMFDKDTKSELWRYECPSVVWRGTDTDTAKRGDIVRLQNPVAQILSEDLFLVGNEGVSKLLEINSKSEIKKEIQAQSAKQIPHGEFRLASKTFENTYLIPFLSSSVLAEYSSDGKLIRSIKTPSGVVSAQRLKDSLTLAGGLFGLIIYDGDGKEIWSMKSDAIAKQLGMQKPIVICGAKALPNGNILCATYSDEGCPDILEISPADNKIVKSLDFPSYSHFSAIRILDDSQKPIDESAAKVKLPKEISL